MKLKIQNFTRVKFGRFASTSVKQGELGRGVARWHKMAATEQVPSTNRRARNPPCPSTDWRSGGVTNHEQRSQYGFRHRQQVRVPPKVTSKHGEIFKGARSVARVKVVRAFLLRVVCRGIDRLPRK